MCLLKILFIDDNPYLLSLEEKLLPLFKENFFLPESNNNGEEINYVRFFEHQKDEINDIIFVKLLANIEIIVLSSDVTGSYINVLNYMTVNCNNFDVIVLDVNLSGFHDTPEGIDPKKLGFDELFQIALGRARDKLKVLLSNYPDLQRLLTRHNTLNTYTNNDFCVMGGSTETTRIAKEVSDFLKGYLFKKQSDVIKSLSSDERVKWIRKLKDLLKVTIENGYEHVNYDQMFDTEIGEKCKYTLRSLFPQQIVILEALTLGIDEDDVIKYYSKPQEVLKSILTPFVCDWPELMCNYDNHRGVLAHPDGLSDEMPFLLLKELDYITCCHYVPLSSFSPELLKNVDFRDQLLFGNKGLDLGIEFALNGQEKFSNMLEYWKRRCPKIIGGGEDFDLDEAILKLVNDFGVYPFDLVYVSHIAIHNKRHIKTAIEPKIIFNFIDDKNMSIRWLYAEEPKDGNSSKFKNAVEKCANNDPNKISGEKIPDAVKIVCGRYNGTLSLKSRYYSFNASWDDDAGKFRCDEVRGPTHAIGSCTEFSISLTSSN
jgi:hypothetical protein